VGTKRTLNKASEKTCFPRQFWICKVSPAQKANLKLELMLMHVPFNKTIKQVQSKGFTKTVACIIALSLKLIGNKRLEFFTGSQVNSNQWLRQIFHCRS
jgi:hypothetical protein